MKFLTRTVRLTFLNSVFTALNNGYGIAMKTTWEGSSVNYFMVWAEPDFWSSIWFPSGKDWGPTTEVRVWLGNCPRPFFSTPSGQLKRPQDCELQVRKLSSLFPLIQTQVSPHRVPRMTLGRTILDYSFLHNCRPRLVVCVLVDRKQYLRRLLKTSDNVDIPAFSAEAIFVVVPVLIFGNPPL